MLYSIEAGVNASPHVRVTDDRYIRQRAPLPDQRTRRGYVRNDVVTLAGLAATVPHRANVVIASGGGYAPASGGGGQPGEGETATTITFYGSSRLPAAASRAAESVPVGRGTSPAAPTAAEARGVGPRRVKFQPSSQGARISRGGADLTHITRGSGSSFPAGGLFDAGVSGVDGFFDDVGRWFAARFRFRRRRSPPPRPQPAPTYQPQAQEGIVVSGVSGFFDDVGGWLKQRVVPPGGKLNRIQPIPRNIRNVIPQPIRKAVRYYGAGTQAAFFPVLSGSQQRRVFGLDAKESRVFMKGQQVSRIIGATILTAGAAKWAWGLKGGVAAAKAGAAGSQGITYAPATSPLSIGTVPAAPKFGTAIFATPASFGGSAASSSVAAGASGAAGSGVLAKTAGLIGKSVAETLVPIAALKMLAGGGAAPGGMMDPGAYAEPASQPASAEAQAQPQSFDVPLGPGGGGASGGSEQPILAGASLPMMAVMGAVILGTVYMTRKRK